MAMRLDISRCGHNPDRPLEELGAWNPSGFHRKNCATNEVLVLKILDLATPFKVQLHSLHSSA